MTDILKSLDRLVLRCRREGNLTRCFLNGEGSVTCPYMSERRAVQETNSCGNPIIRIYYECGKFTVGRDYPPHTILPRKEIERIYPNRGEEKK